MRCRTTKLSTRCKLATHTTGWRQGGHRPPTKGHLTDSWSGLLSGRWYPATWTVPWSWMPAADPERRHSGCWNRRRYRRRRHQSRMIEEAERRCAGRGRFLVADLARPLPLEPRSLDGITCSLALHYTADWSVPLRSFASALRPGGWAVISLDHPFGPRLPHQRGGYFDTELVSDTWGKADVEVTQQFWRRPLAGALGAFADAGFKVDRVAEPQPSAEALRLFPDDLGPLVGVPSFIVYRLWLQP